MLARDPVKLVREGREFVALSSTSMQQLAQIRTFLALPDSADPTTFDDDLVAAIYRAFASNCRFYLTWDPAPVAKDRAAFPYLQLGRMPMEFAATAAGQPMMTTHRDQATATCPADGAARRAVALLTNRLADGGSHRCSIRILSAPATADDDSTPHCLFGVCNPEGALYSSKESGNAATPDWAALQWSVGMSTPLAPTLTAVTSVGKPHVQAVTSRQQTFVQVGDVITVELSAAVPVDDHPAVITLSYFLNGAPIISLRHAQLYQPLSSTTAVSGVLVPERVARAKGVTSCQFGVMLTRGVSVAVLSPKDA